MRKPRRRVGRRVASGMGQQPLPLEPPKEKPKRGGRRVGAGRPAKGSRASQGHKTRPRFRGLWGHHVTIRTVDAVRGLRKRDAYAAVRRALATTFGKRGFRVVHLSIQTNHIHLIVEASDAMALARGMQGFQISAAQHLNRCVSARRPGPRRRGRVFVDRYDAVRLTSPRHARSALAYVLCNWRKHHVDAGTPAAVRLDPYSSAIFFDGWREPERPFLLSRQLEPLPVAVPRSWMLTTGWRRAGLLSPHERPGR